MSASPDTAPDRHVGTAVADYAAPLFVAWQLTNGCTSQCLACCEESGPDRLWPDELTRTQALALARQIVADGIPYVAFGGGEPLTAPHCWELLELLARAGVAVKLETDGSLIDDSAADHLARLAPECIQISLDGATPATHARVRPGSSHAAAVAAIQRLVARGQPPQAVFVPNRHNLHELSAAFDQAAQLGCSAFVTGPMMRIGRAATQWQALACSDADWDAAVRRLRHHSRTVGERCRLEIYPWDILTEMERRLASPQAMLLIVPNGRVKLLNALPFTVADLRRDSLAEAWQAYRDGWRAPEVHRFIAACRDNPALLSTANATWTLSAPEPGS